MKTGWNDDSVIGRYNETKIYLQILQGEVAVSWAVLDCLELFGHSDVKDSGWSQTSRIVVGFRCTGAGNGVAGGQIGEQRWPRLIFQ